MDASMFVRDLALTEAWNGVWSLLIRYFPIVFGYTCLFGAISFVFKFLASFFKR